MVQQVDAVRDAPSTDGIVGARQISIAPVHIVIAGWIYVIAMVALAMKSTFAAIVTFALLGCAPVALYAWVAHARHARRREARRRQDGDASGLERDVHAGDDRDA